MEQIFINGEWREARASGSFRAENPATKQPLAEEYPVSSWEDCESALDAAVEAFEALRKLPRERIAQFLDTYASRIEARKVELVSIAAQETALPASPRLGDVELPRTTAQLRQAAAAARTGRWALPTIDTAANIRSCYAGIGPVCVFGPNNFPFAFGSVSGGDFAAAIAAGNPVIGKANSSHPGTTRIFAEEAGKALVETRMPPAMVQLLYRTSHANGERLVSDPRLGATGYTGSRNAGLKAKIKEALVADRSLISGRVDVYVYAGHAVLIGVVDDPEQIHRYIDDAQGVPGVVSVRSYIQLPD